MNINKIIEYEQYVFDFIDKYAKRVRKIQKSITVSFFAVINLLEIITNFAVDQADNLYALGRQMTRPLHYIWIWGWLYKIKSKDTTPPIFETGAHFIYGLPAAGKSTMTYHAMMDYAYQTGKTAYTTEQMEIPRTDLDGEEYYYHQVFDPSDFFSDGIQTHSFDDDKNFIVYEEMLTKYNARNNNQKVYNSEVIPMIGSMGTQRHQGIDLFFFISQQPKADTQIMNMLAGYHEPRIRKVFDYDNWLKTGKFGFRIKGWWITSSKIVRTGADGYRIQRVKRWFYENKFDEHFKYFNRLNMKAKYDALPKVDRKEWS